MNRKLRMIAADLAVLAFCAGAMLGGCASAPEGQTSKYMEEFKATHKDYVFIEGNDFDYAIKIGGRDFDYFAARAIGAAGRNDESSKFSISIVEFGYKYAITGQVPKGMSPKSITLSRPIVYGEGVVAGDTMIIVNLLKAGAWSHALTGPVSLDIFGSFNEDGYYPKPMFAKDGSFLKEKKVPIVVAKKQEATFDNGWNAVTFFSSLGPFKIGESIPLTSGPAGKDGAPSKNPRAAESLAKGTAAEEADRFGEALYWYYTAERYDNSFTQAIQRRIKLLARIKSGNPWGITGNNSTQIYLETEKRWPILRKETADFFAANNPFLADTAGLIFNPMELSKGSLNRQDGTVTYTASPKHEGSGYNVVDNPAEVFRTSIKIDEAIKTMEAIGVRKELLTHYVIQAVLVNGNGKVIATTPEPPERFTRFSRGDYGNNFLYQTRILYPTSTTTAYGTTLVTKDPRWDGYNITKFTGGVTFTVPVADITDTGMYARVIKVYQYTDPDDNKGVFELVKTRNVGR